MRQSHKHKLTKEQKLKIFRLHHEGVSKQLIAERFGIVSSYISTIIKEVEMALPQPGGTA